MMLKKKYISLLIFLIYVINSNIYSQISLKNPSDNSIIISGNNVTLEWENPSGNPVDIYYLDGITDKWILIVSDVVANSYIWSPPNSLFGNIKIKLKCNSYSKPQLIWAKENAHDGEVREAVFSESGKFIATIGSDNRVIVWNIELRQIEDEIFMKDVNSIRSVKFFDTDDALFFCADNKIFVWDRTNKIVEAIFTDSLPNSFFYYLDIDKKNNIIAAANIEYHIIICDIATNKIYFDVPMIADRVYACKFSENGNYLAYSRDDEGKNGYISLIDMQKKQYMGEFAKHGDGSSNSVIWSIDFISENKFASCGVDRNIKLWEIGNPNEIFNFTGHTGHIRSVKYSKHLNTLLSGSLDNTIRQWDLTLLKPISTVTIVHGGQVLSVGYTETGDTLLSSGRDRSFKLWKNFVSITDSLIFSLNIKLNAKIYIPNNITALAGQMVEIPLILEMNNTTLNNKKFKAEFEVEIPSMLLNSLNTSNETIPFDTLKFNFEATYQNGICFSFPTLALQSYYYFDSLKIIYFKISDNNLVELEKENGSIYITTECYDNYQRHVLVGGDDKVLKFSPNPVSGKIEISMTPIESASYLLTLSNLNGDETVLFEGYIKDGNENVTFDMSKFDVGTYYLNLKWKNKFETEKLLLIH